MATRLFTVEVTVNYATDVHRDFDQRKFYECFFATVHFSRANESDLKKWVRVAARNVYGKGTQVIFVHKEGAEQ